MTDLDARIEALKDPHLLTAYCEQHLERRGPKSFVCPSCGSGAGPNHTAAFTIRNGKWKCFSCGEGGDLLDLIKITEGIEDFKERLQYVAEWAGIDDGGTPTAATAPKPSKPKEEERKFSRARAAELAKVEGWRTHIHDAEAVSFLQERGIDGATAEEWHLGYDPSRGRIVIPYRGAEWYHTDRALYIDEPKYLQPDKKVVGPSPLWNAEALNGAAYFVVEGELDALAIEWAGYPAIATGGTGGAEKLVKEAAAIGSDAVAIILFDNDNAGKDGSKRLATAFKEHGLKYVQPDSEECLAPQKDPQQVMKEDPNGLKDLAESLYTSALVMAQKKAEEDYQSVLDRAHVIEPSSVANGIYGMTDPWEYVSTGIEPLDRILGGGVPDRGVVVFGAVSSAGKTTMLVQIADHMAAQGRSVLFCSVEQSAQELTAKSLSRIANTLYLDDRGKPYKIEASSILNASARLKWSDLDRGALRGAVEWYNAYVAPNLRYMEPEGRPTVEEICSVARHMADKIEAPVVIVDYLQLIRPEDPHATDKQATDQAMTALRQLARELKTPVIVVSSLNRASYDGGIHEDSWKESGGVEYGADVLLGMQPYGLEDAIKTAPAGKKVEAAQDIIATFKQSPSRECELICLKNRNGRIPSMRPKVTLEASVSRFWWDQFWWDTRHDSKGLTEKLRSVENAEREEE